MDPKSTFELGCGALVLACAPLLVHWLRRRDGGSSHRLGSVGAYALVLGMLGMGGIAADHSVALHAIALVCVKASTGLVGLFVFRTFRRRTQWPRLALLSLIAFAGASLWLDLATVGRHGIPPSEAAYLVGQLATLAPFLWLGIECAWAWDRQRRQRAIGLGDPATRNRFGLSAIACALVVGVCGVSALEALGFVGTPTSLTLRGAAYLVLSPLVLFVFVPPAGYLRWLQGGGSPSPTPTA